LRRCEDVNIHYRLDENEPSNRSTTASTTEKLAVVAPVASIITPRITAVVVGEDAATATRFARPVRAHPSVEYTGLTAHHKHFSGGTNGT
jgi:hypothetical protein